MSKTFNTIEYLKKNNINYKYINSYATPLSFYEILYKNSDKDIVVFDDVSSIANPLIISMQKSACWASDGKKIVSWYSTSKILESRGLPENFEFNANVILIFNTQLKGYRAIINRGIKIDFNFNFQDKLKIFEEIQQPANITDEVMEYIKTNCNEATKNLSIRTLVILSNIQNNNQDFRIFADEILGKDEDKELLLTLSAKDWSKETGHHIRTYYKKRKRLGV